MARKNELQEALIEALRDRHQPAETSFVSPKNINVLVMGVLAAVGALLWSNATEKPLENAQAFATIQQQTAEVRTVVLEMRGTLTGMNARLEDNTKNTSNLQSRVAALEARVEGGVQKK